MKLTILFISLMAITLLSGCKKDMKEVPYSFLSPDNIFIDEEGLKKATYGVYEGWTAMVFYDVYFRFILAETGHRYATSGLSVPGGYQDPYYRFGHNPSNGQANSVWNRMFNIIARANAVIANANKAVVDSAVASRYIAEARFQRAYAYFNLARDFGGVPLITSAITSLEQKDLIYGAKSTLQQTYDFIVEDILYAEANLPDQWTGPDIGRISAGTAKAMLGKVYLTMAGKPLMASGYFEKAAEKLKEVVGTENETRYGFALEDHFKNIFSVNNERNKEIILSFGYFHSSNSPDANIYPIWFFPPGLVNGDEVTLFGLTQDFYNLYEDMDERRDFTLIARYKYAGTPSNGAEVGDSIVYDPQTKHYYNKRTNEIFGNPAVKCGIAFGKFDRSGRPAGTQPWSYSNDLIELRFADVLLCLAEALVESGKEGDAVPLLNRVRARAGASVYNSLPADMRAAVRKERRIELTGEYTTVYDIRRWGTLAEEIAAMSPEQIHDGNLPAYSAKFELYPIPQSQIDANPNLEQNTGWK